MTTGEREATFRSDSPEATLFIGADIGHSMPGGLVIALVGPLGAGKTQLVKGIATGNAKGSVCEVTSPTFSLVQEYSGRLALYHLDAYRLTGSKDFSLLGFDEMIRHDSGVVVEWADRVTDMIPPDALWITIEPIHSTSRSFRLHALGDLSRVVFDAIPDSVDNGPSRS